MGCTVVNCGFVENHSPQCVRITNFLHWVKSKMSQTLISDPDSGYNSGETLCKFSRLRGLGPGYLRLSMYLSMLKMMMTAMVSTWSRTDPSAELHRLVAQ